MLLKALGLPAQQWLFEPRGVFTLIADYFGKTIPAWAAGPSLAMSVIILHSIWTFVGYNTVIYLAGLGNIPKELNDSAEVDMPAAGKSFATSPFRCSHPQLISCL